MRLRPFLMMMIARLVEKLLLLYISFLRIETEINFSQLRIYKTIREFALRVKILHRRFCV